MMTPTTHLRIISLILGFGVVLLLSGCRKPSTSMYPQNTTTAKPHASITPKATTEEKQLRLQAIETVREYLSSLEKGKYAAAYDMLSEDSRKQHLLSDFEQLAKQGMPSFDLSTAVITTQHDSAKVELHEMEDYASHEFSLAREGKEWKIVYRGGSPGSPYPDD